MNSSPKYVAALLRVKLLGEEEEGTVPRIESRSVVLPLPVSD